MDLADLVTNAAMSIQEVEVNKCHASVVDAVSLAELKSLCFAGWYNA